MILQVQEALKDAMGLIGVIEIDESPSSSEMAVALRTANVMLGRFASNHLFLRASTPLTFTLTVGKASYTVGTDVSNDVVAAKPIKVLSGYTSDISASDNPMQIVTVQDYNNFYDKQTPGLPAYVAFNPGASQQAINSGTILVYPNPDAAYVLHLETDGYLTEFVNLTDTITFEPAYYEMFIYNLAVRLFRRYNTAGAMLPPDVVMIANNSLTNIKAMNAVQITANLDCPGTTTGGWDVYSDGYI